MNISSLKSSSEQSNQYRQDQNDINVQNYEQELKNYKQQIQQLENQLKTERKLIYDQNIQIQTLQNQENQLKKQLDEKNKDLVEKNSNLSKLQKEIDTCQKELQTLKSENKTLLEQNQKIQTLKDQCNDFSKKFDKSQEENNQLKEKCENMEQSLNAANKNIQDKNIENQQLNNQNKELQNNFNSQLNENKKLLLKQDDYQKQQEEFKQKTSQLQDRIEELTEESERFQNHLKLVSRQSQSIQNYKITTYDHQIRLTHLFVNNPMVKDFFRFKCEQSTFNKTVSLLSYQKGSSYLLSQILQKNFTNQKNSNNDFFIYNYKLNKQQSYQFLNTKKMGQPISCCKQIENKNNNQYQQLYETEILTDTMINNFLIELLSNISDIQILIVNEVTQQEQNLIMRLKQDFLLSGDIENNKQLIVVHLLSQYDNDQIEKYSEKIQDFFKLFKIENEEENYLMDQEFQNISHFIIGNENLQEKERYFTQPINKIKQIIFKQYIYGNSIHDRIKEFINERYAFYVQISDQKTDTQCQQLQLKAQSQNNQSLEVKKNQEMQCNQVDYQYEKQYFIKKEDDLVLNQELHEFLEVKNYYYKLQMRTIIEFQYKISYSKDEQKLIINVCNTGQLSEIDIDLIDSQNKLLINAQQQIPNSNKLQSVRIQLQNHIFKFYELNNQTNQKSFENKDGSLIINLKRTSKYAKQKIADLCKYFEPYYQLSQLSIIN
ncbi:hypothetical protein ABPG74_010120 [Tetrahymena malaccensis]